MENDPQSQWRPQALLDGDDPDARFTLANERTLLAWARTSLGMVSGALALEALGGQTLPPIVRITLTCALLGVAALLAIGAFKQWITIESDMRHKRPLSMPQSAIVLAPAITAGAVLLVLTLLSGVGR